MSSALFSIENCEVVIGGTLPNFECACQVPLVSIGFVHNVVPESGVTLHGVSVVSIQELARIHNCTPTRKTRSLSMLKIREMRQSCYLVVLQFYQLLVSFFSQSQGVITISWLCVPQDH